MTIKSSIRQPINFACVLFIHTFTLFLFVSTIFLNISLEEKNFWLGVVTIGIFATMIIMQVILGALNAGECGEEAKEKGAKHCLYCDLMREQDARHCFYCKTCVRGFDHHCKILGVCIGKGNYKAFYLLLITATLGHLSMSVTVIFQLINVSLDSLYGKSVFLNDILCLVICSIPVILLLPLLIFHTYLCCVGISAHDKHHELEDCSKAIVNMSHLDLNTQKMQYAARSEVSRIILRAQQLFHINSSNQAAQPQIQPINSKKIKSSNEASSLNQFVSKYYNQPKRQIQERVSDLPNQGLAQNRRSQNQYPKYFYNDRSLFSMTPQFSFSVYDQAKQNQFQNKEQFKQDKQTYFLKSSMPFEVNNIEMNKINVIKKNQIKKTETIQNKSSY